MMEVLEITNFTSGIEKAGVSYLQPSDSFEDILNGFVYRQELQSRRGFSSFGGRLSDESRVTGIFDFIEPDGSRSILVTDMNFLYKYNTGTNVFDQIPFAGSVSAYAGFGISDNESYVSGTAYPTASNASRFIICGPGINATASGSAIFFYDGTSVYDYTSVVDNTDYAAPIDGALARADYVLYHNERVNFIIPTILTERNQGILFSGIRTLSGNGDKFNVAGSGTIEFSTYEKITGATLLGQDMVVLFQESTRVLEITTDPFNPYKLRNIPSFIGTDAPFSAVGHSNDIESVGRNGILKTDGRQSLRIDNKIPFFTFDEIDQSKFDLTYGGENRNNGQFLWSYLEAEGGSTQDRVLVRNYEEDSWGVYDQRVSVFGSVIDGRDLTWDDIDETSGEASWETWDTTVETWNKIGLGDKTYKVLAGDDLGFVYQFDSGSSDYDTAITAITKATQAVLTVSACGIQANDLVLVSSVTGMTEINNFDPALTTYVDNQYYTVVSATPTSITLNVDSSTFTTYSSGGLLTKAINFSAKTIPLNPYRQLGRKYYISHIEVLINTLQGALQLSIFEDEEETAFKQQVLLNPTRDSQNREWVSMSVNQECNFVTLLFELTSSIEQLKISSVRIHGQAGGFTSE